MERMIKGPIETRSKISLNVNDSILSLVKDLASLTKTNNTLVIESLLVRGIRPLVEQFKSTWMTMSVDTKEGKKKESLNKLVKDLEKICSNEIYKPFFSV
ncbi:MAG: hypothetical protein KKC19_03530 [Nanoarchaeota archaeon]|nr:hypothetical protein [Nanoarchaeota archaeon]